MIGAGGTKIQQRLMFQMQGMQRSGR
jgi:hypothetical protein